MFLRAPPGLSQKLNFHICLLLPSLSCVFADLYIPGYVYSPALWSLIAGVYWWCPQSDMSLIY